MSLLSFVTPPHALARRVLLLLSTSLMSLACSGQGTGYWHTAGNQILDSNNKPVRIAGVNWYGFETTSAVAHGLYVQDYKAILNAIKSNGFNTVRLPLSSQMIETPATSLNISFTNSAGAINTDLKGMNSMQVLDQIVGYAGSIGLKVILDHHRSEAGNSAEANGLWYTSAYPESAWINDWVALAKHYAGNPTVIGFDLHNEPHAVSGGGACWDCGGAGDWHLAAERAGNAVLATNPNLLVFVEGVDVYNGDYYFWGGNLEGVLKSPVALATSNHLVYSAHDYGPHESAQGYFNGSTNYSVLSSVWNKHWAYISQNNIAPVWLGEFGTTNVATDIASTVAGSQGQWFQSMIEFLNADPNLSWTYWALNGEDSYGYLDNSYDSSPANATKAAMLASNDFPFGSTTPTPAAPTGLTAKSLSSSQIGLAWNSSTTPGVTYSVYFSTNSTGTGTLLASGLTATTYQANNLNCCAVYFFTVKAVAGGVSSAASAPASAAITPPTPAAPTGLTAVAASNTLINLAWAASASVGVAYTVYVGSSPSSVNTVAATGVTGTTYQAGGLNPGTSYSFAVKAVEQSVSSAASNVASATTKAVVPTAPSGLVATVVSATQINLAWTASPTTGVTYNVYASSTAGGAGSLVSSGLMVPSFQALGLKPATTFYFTVRAASGGLISSASNVVSATTQTTPTVACHVSYSTTSDWGTGFTAAISITNPGSTPVKGWTLSWTYGGNQRLTQSWDGVFTQQGEVVKLTNLSFNSTIAPNATISGIGFQASYSGKNYAPATFYLNGVACN